MRDNPLKYMIKAQSKKFGKFKQQKNPMLIWEPSNQETIVTLANQYLQSDTEDMPLGGLRFSINIDPINFEIFSSSQSQYGSNRRVKHTEEFLDAKFVKISKDQLLLIHTNTDGLVYASLLKSQKTLAIEKTSPVGIDTSKQGVVVSIFQDNTQDAVTLITSMGLVVVISNLKKISETTIPNTKVFDVKKQDSKYFVLEEQDSIVFLSVYKNEGKEFKRHQKYKLEDIDVETLKHATLVPNQEKGIIMFSTTKRLMYAMSWKLTKEDFSTSSPVPISVGQNPQVKLVAAHNKQLVVLLWEDGFCYNADLHNLQEQPLLCNLKGKSCNNVLNYMIIEFNLFEKLLSSQQSVSDNEFNEQFYPWTGKYQPPKPHFSIANPCSPFAIMGTYDRGSNIHFDIIEASKKSEESKAFEDPYLRVLEIHRGVAPRLPEERPRSTEYDPFANEKLSITAPYASMLNNDFATCACGEAVPHEGLVVDKFYIPIDKYISSLYSK